MEVSCCKISVIYNSNHQAYAILIIVRDITEHKKAEQALIENEERSRKAFDVRPDAFVITSLNESTIVECNDVFLEMLGYSEQEVMGKSALELNIWADPSEREEIAQILKSLGKVRNKEAFTGGEMGRFFQLYVRRPC